MILLCLQKQDAQLLEPPRIGKKLAIETLILWPAKVKMQNLRKKLPFHSHILFDAPVQQQTLEAARLLSKGTHFSLAELALRGVKVTFVAQNFKWIPRAKARPDFTCHTGQADADEHTLMGPA